MASSKKRATRRGKKASQQALEPGASPISGVVPPPEHRFKPGQSGNPGGRPKLLSHAYRDWLEKVNSQGITNAEAVAMAMGVKALEKDVSAAREIRSATEGDTLHLATWQTEIVDALKAGNLTAQDVINELGLEDARAILVAAGTAIPESTPPSAPTETTGDTDTV